MKPADFFILAIVIDVEHEFDLKMRGDLICDSLHDFFQTGLKTEMILLDQLLYGDQIILNAEAFDPLEVGEPDMECFHGLQFLTLQVFILGHIQGIEVLLSSIDIQILERDRVFDRSHRNNRKVIQHCRLSMSEGNTGKSLVGVLVF